MLGAGAVVRLIDGTFWGGGIAVGCAATVLAGVAGGGVVGGEGCIVVLPLSTAAGVTTGEDVGGCWGGVVESRHSA